MSTPLLDLVRHGDLPGVRTLLTRPDAAGPARAVIRTLREQMLANPIGTRDAAWVGALTENHVDALQLVHLAGMTAERAASEGGVSRRVAESLPELFPDELGVFVETWSRLFQRNPRNWDRTAHHPTMFLWAGAGLVEAPTHDGAVNLWLQFAPWLVHPRGTPAPGEPAGWRFPTPDACPDLYTVTLPLLFEAEVRPGLGAAAHDHTSGGEVLDLIEHLVAIGVWDRAATLTRAETALASPRRAAPFQQRWLRKVVTALSSAP